MKNTLILIGTLLVIGVLCLIVIKYSSPSNQPASVPLYPITNPPVQVTPEVSASPYGILAVNGNTWNKPIPAEVFLDPSVNGIITHIRWNIVESDITPGLYDWSVIDADLTNAVLHGKNVEIDFASGRYLPLYLYNAPYNVPKLNLTTGNGTCAKYPVFWHPALITAYINVINAMAAHINEHPDWKSALKTVTFLTTNDATSELRIGLEQGMVPNPVCGESSTFGNTNEAWKALGYRPSKALATNNTIFDVVKNAFPDKMFKIFPIPANAFPPIGEDGVIVTTDQKVLSDATTTSIINSAIQKFGAENMIVGWTALNATNGSVPLVDAAVAQGATRRYQLEYRKYGDLNCLPDGGVSPCDEVDFKAALDNAFTREARALEVFTDDVKAYPNALSYIKQKFEVYKPAFVPTVNFIPRKNNEPDVPVKPVVSITSPSNGAIIPINSVTPVTASYSDDVKVTRIKMYYKPGNVTFCDKPNPLTPTYTCNMSTSYVSAGTYVRTIYVDAFDAAGNMTEVSRNVTIQ